MTSLLRATPAALFALFSMSALAQDGQACDITNLPCWGPESKCNIKIVNNTGESSGSAGGHFNQVSWAVTVKALALKPDGSRAGGNTLEILAGQSRTINLDKKAGFDRIKILTATGAGGNVKIPCDDIQQILQDERHCKILIDSDNPGENNYYYLAFNCGVAWGKGDEVWIW
jgi:hypothetical protein